MIFAVSVVVIFVISLVWALFSLKREISKPKEIHHARKELFKEKILFQKD